MDSDAFLPISLVAHTVFCERRAWLESVGETVASVAIEAGVADHARVDARKDERVTERRSVAIDHQDLGLTGRCDVLGLDGEAVTLIEFKSAPLRRATVVTEAQRVQLALQRLCLEAAGHTVAGQAIYYTTSRRTVTVDLTEEDLRQAVGYVERTRDVVSRPHAPLPLVDDPRCGRCSHSSVCLPDEHQERATRRRITVPDPGGHVVHVTTPGSRVSLQKGRVVVLTEGEEIASLPVERVQGVVVHGNVDVSTALVRELTWTGRTLTWCTATGRVTGFARPARSANGLARVEQHVRSAQGDLPLARELIGAKISNQATQLRRNARDGDESAVRRMRALATSTRTARSAPELLGFEGEAAAIYFERLPTMLAPHGLPLAAHWPGRVGRGATDELNVALNLVYGLLLVDQIRAVVAAGLDPHAGFVHSSGRNKPALALDLMEQFRPVVADSVVLGAINNGELTPTMFTRVFGDSRLRDTGRRALISAYERRVTAEFKHPVFGYRVTWRRAMEIQARMVLGVLDGSQESYVGIRMR